MPDQSHVAQDGQTSSPAGDWTPKPGDGLSAPKTQTWDHRRKGRITGTLLRQDDT